VDLRIRRPYIDLSKFYHDYDRIPSLFADEVPRMPEKREEREVVVAKRPPPMPLSARDLGEEEQRKKVKRDETVYQQVNVLPPSPVKQSREGKGVIE
jgi:hypothetical protein